MNEVWPAEPDEWRAYREIRLASLADAPRMFGSTLERELRLTESEWRARLTNSRTFFGAREGDLLAIATGLSLTDGNAELVGVWAHPSARGTGLAAEVVGAVLTWAKDRPHVYAWVAEGNPAAERLYAKLGFRRTGEQQLLPSDPTRQEFLLVTG
jgi:RimJ/RimL family protein N-acetyltransferase